MKKPNPEVEAMAAEIFALCEKIGEICGGHQGPIVVIALAHMIMSVSEQFKGDPAFRVGAITELRRVIDYIKRNNHGS
jgi:hypothetical protein